MLSLLSLVKILFNHVSDIAVLLLSHKVSLQFVYQAVVMQSFRIQRENTLQYPTRQYKDEHEQFKHEVAVVLKPKVSRKLNCCVEFSVVDCRDNTNKVISHRAVIEREKSITLSFIYLVALAFIVSLQKWPSHSQPSQSCPSLFFHFLGGDYTVKKLTVLILLSSLPMILCIHQQEWEWWSNRIWKLNK